MKLSPNPPAMICCCTLQWGPLGPPSTAPLNLDIPEAIVTTVGVTCLFSAIVGSVRGLLRHSISPVPV